MAYNEETFKLNSESSSPSCPMFASDLSLSLFFNFEQSFFQCLFLRQKAHSSFAVGFDLPLDLERVLLPDVLSSYLPLTVNASDDESLWACLSFF